MALIFDCDNTFGIPGRDIDDALALLYLLSDATVDIVGLTTSFGNGTQEEVWRATELFVDRAGLRDLQMRRGCEGPGERKSDAVDFIRHSLETQEGLDILVTGSAANIAGALAQRPELVRRAGRIVMMGGITDPLLIGGAEMGELNISCDYSAVATLLRSGALVEFVTANLCLEVFADESKVGFLERSFARSGRSWVSPVMRDWCSHLESKYGTYGFHPWDLVAAVYLTDPHIFSIDRVPMSIDEDLLSIGRLAEISAKMSGHIGHTGQAAEILLPSGVDVDRFWSCVDRKFSKNNLD